jgi:hypothetical protein
MLSILLAERTTNSQFLPNLQPRRRPPPDAYARLSATSGRRNASASVPRTLPTWAGNDISMHREAPSVLRRADRELPLEYTAQVLFIAVTRVRGNALER